MSAMSLMCKPPSATSKHSFCILNNNNYMSALRGAYTLVSNYSYEIRV